MAPRPTLHLHLHRTEAEHRVTSLELFFDLVFVLALTQVTTYLAANLDVRGAVRGVLVLAVMWWSWTGYAWLTNYVRADHGVIRLILVTVMGAGLVMTLSIPEAFDDKDGRSPSGPLVFAGAYFVLRLMHLLIFFVAGRDDPGLVRTLVRFAVSFTLGTGTLVVAAFTDGPLQTGLWALALFLDAGLTILFSAGGWRLNSPSHFAERHGLIIILALGESLVAVGVGTQGLSLTWGAVAAALLSLALVTCLWWTYFDVVAAVAEQRLSSLDGAARATLARDSYSYLHFPMVVGIIFIALGLKKTLGYVSDAEHSLTDPLHGLPLYALYGGTALYLLAHIAFRLRNLGTLNRQRLVAAVVVALLALVVGDVPALGQLAILATALVALCTYESVRFRAFRNELRHDPSAGTPERVAQAYAQTSLHRHGHDEGHGIAQSPAPVSDAVRGAESAPRGEHD